MHHGVIALGDEYIGPDPLMSGNDRAREVAGGRRRKCRIECSCVSNNDARSGMVGCRQTTPHAESQPEDLRSSNLSCQLHHPPSYQLHHHALSSFNPTCDNHLQPLSLIQHHQNDNRRPPCSRLPPPQRKSRHLQTSPQDPQIPRPITPLPPLPPLPPSQRRIFREMANLRKPPRSLPQNRRR